MRVFEKAFRRLPCVFSQTLSTAKALFPQVFLHFFRFLSHFSGFQPFFAVLVKDMKPLTSAGPAHFRAWDVA
jgi:hypothetical protein